MRIIMFLLCCLAVFPAAAQLKEFDNVYDVDLHEEIPMVWRLQKEYKQSRNRYDHRYKYYWDIPAVFDADFKKQIKTFGSVEKRIDNPDEEVILRQIKRLPKVFYPYIGPMLHNKRGLSGKILDLPGIKETKNRFPEKIASAMEKIPDIEFVSPEMYVYLSPQFWGEDLQSLEFPQVVNDIEQEVPDIRIDPEFILRVKSKVKASDYSFGKKPQPLNLGFRHFKPDASTPLSSADVKAFMDTFEGLRKFRLNKNNEIRLILIERIINYWDEKNGVNPQAAYLKGVVNPCQSIVRKVNWSGLKKEFQEAIGAQGFGLEDWAYTCDKAIKAVRYTDIPNAYIATLKVLRKGYFYQQFEKYDFSEEERLQQKYFLEALIRMYDTTPENIKAVRPFARELREKLVNMNLDYMGTPIIIP